MIFVSVHPTSASCDFSEDLLRKTGSKSHAKALTLPRNRHQSRFHSPETGSWREMKQLWGSLLWSTKETNINGQRQFATVNANSERLTSTIARNYTSLPTTRCKCPATFLGSRTLPLPASEQRNLPSPDEGARQCSNRIYLKSVWSFIVIFLAFSVWRICLQTVWVSLSIFFPFTLRRICLKAV